MAVATWLAKAVFAVVTGVSIAAEATCSKSAYPEMRRYGYELQFSFGCIAGSACRGMLIPPSVLMIVWGVLTELAIGKLFVAGIVAGLLVVSLYVPSILWGVISEPHRVVAVADVADHEGGVVEPSDRKRGRLDPTLPCLVRSACCACKHKRMT